MPRRRRHGWCWWWCGPTVAPLRRAVVGFPVAESEQGVDVATMLRVQGADRLRVVRPRWHEGADLLERAERRRAPREHHLGVRRPRVELAAIDHGGNPGIVQPVIRSVQDRGTPGRRVHVVSVVRAQWDSAQSHPARSQDHPLAAIASPWRVAGTHALRAQPVERAVEVGVARLHGADGKGCPRRAHQRQRRQLRQRATATVAAATADSAGASVAAPTAVSTVAPSWRCPLPQPKGLTVVLHGHLTLGCRHCHAPPCRRHDRRPQPTWSESRSSRHASLPKALARGWTACRASEAHTHWARSMRKQVSNS